MARYLNELDAVTSLQDTDILLVRQSGVDKKTTLDKFTSITIQSGFVYAYVGSTAPDGWLLCDGSAVDRITYEDLFNVIGTTYGIGDGSTTFNLPDYRGQFLRGAGTHGSQTMANGTAYNGGSLGDYEEDGFQPHDHLHWRQYDYSNESGTDYSCANNKWTSRWMDAIGSYSDYDTPRIKYETKPTSYSVNYIIKY